MVPLKITFTRLMVGAIAALVIGGTKAHDPDHTDQNEWYQSLMQPDVPTSSCCGEADAYWADEIPAQRQDLRQDHRRSAG